MLRPARGLPIPRGKVSWPTRSDLIDLAVALLAAGIAAVATLTGDHDPGDVRVYVATNVAMTLPLAVRRRFPVSTLVAILAVIVVEAAIAGPSEGIGALALLIACYTVAEYRSRLPAVVALAGLVLAFVISNVVSGKGALEDVDFVVVLCVGAWVVGRSVRSRQRLVDELAAQSEELRAARQAEADAVASAERARIARDLHDVLAHSMSVIVVQAEAAEALLPDLDRSRQALQAVQRTGRDALAELRQLLDVLHEDDAENDPAAMRRPTPRLRDAGRLAEAMREAGLDVVLHVDGIDVPVPDGVDLAAYRILQEGMTNALRHAGPCTVEAQVHIDPTEVIVSVVDDGPPDQARTESNRGAGRGIEGMRARARMYGGRLEAGRAGTGFRVTATIPIKPRA